MTALLMNKILIVDDELSIRESFSLILEGKYKLFLAASGEAALKITVDQKIDLVYLDIRMPGLNGLETLKRIKEIDPSVEVIMVTAVNDVQKASEAVKLGAKDYIVKPFDVDVILKMAETVLRRKSLVREGKEAQKTTPQLIGQSEKIIEITKIIEKIASKDLRVLILGEPGTEKEIVAELIHTGSPRAASPFRVYDLSAQLSPSEIRTNLFGMGKGSTTIELEKISGLFEEARGGTVFLNHIEYLPPDLTAFQTVEARLIAGSNLAEFPEKSRESFDFFSEVLITLPPLRERTSDLPLLIKYYLDKFSEKYGKEGMEISPEAEELFSNYAWPGNTEELESLLERLVITAPDAKINTADLPFDLLLKSPGAPGSDYLSAFEKDYIQKVFDSTGRDQEKTSALLGIGPALLESKI